MVTSSGVLATSGRVVRLVVTVVVSGLLLAGTFAGSDDHFPFGPFSMYSSAHDPNAGVVSNTVEAVLDDGRVVAVSDGDTGMRRAEVEGQLPRFVEDPQMLEQLAVAHERRRPGAPRYAAVRVVRRSYQLRDGRPVGAVTEDIVAEWRRP
ncbi:MAG: hypothetical protein KY450_14175 [Actinobacteria bacterium]|nr:hypothetical protein [Actinomycetota bacterium]